MGAIRVEAIYISPVKSLALTPVTSVHVGRHGIAEDRRFFIVEERGRLFSQRECGQLALVRADYSIEPEQLTLRFPDGTEAAGTPEIAEAISARFFGKRDVEGHVVRGPWSEALSDFAGRPVRLVRAASTAFDALPVSMCSTASLDALRAQAGDGAAVDARRFRPNFLLGGCTPHQEDGWLDETVHIGEAEVRIRMRDSRCEITTHNPDTGVRDIDTLGLIASYRLDQPKQVNFGVYGTVEREGHVAVEDEVRAPSRV